MMYDDVAYDPRNPNTGELHNIPNGPDYRKSIVVDYKSTSVNKHVFQAVLLGDSVFASKYEGTGKVLKSTGVDNVFIYYTDHGAYNILGMPNGPPITKTDLLGYIERARELGKFRNLSIYIEACESGSMLIGLETEVSVNGLTASNATEDSYACNCAKGICYADLFSYKWISNSEQHDLMKFSIQQQYGEVKNEVGFSTVQIFGSSDATNELVASFQGFQDRSEDVLLEKFDTPSEHLEVINIRDVHIHLLTMKVKQLREGQQSTRAVQELRQAIETIAEKRKKRKKVERNELQGIKDVMRLLQLYTPQNGSIKQRYVISAKNQLISQITTLDPAQRGSFYSKDRIAVWTNA